MKYKILKEYKRYYLCESEIGHYKECFDKTHKPQDGYIYISKRTKENELAEEKIVDRIRPDQFNKWEENIWVKY